MDCLCRPSLLSSACGARRPGVAPEQHYITSQNKLHQNGSRTAGREHSSRGLVALVQTVQDLFCPFVPDEKSPGPLMCCASANLTAGTGEAATANTGENTPTPMSRSNSSRQFLRISSRHPPLVSDLHIFVVTFKFFFCWRGYLALPRRQPGSVTAPSNGSRKWHLTQPSGRY